MESKTFILKCWGPLACFSRPDGGKIERFSYPIPTPSAVRGIFSAIYSKPIEFWWQPVKVEVLQPIQYIALRRNEVKDKISVNALQKTIKGGDFSPLIADADETFIGTDKKGRSQRQTMALKDVTYRLHAKIIPQSEFAHSINALESQFIRRAEKGKCFFQPSFGCKEFAAYFEPVADIISAQKAEPADERANQEIGYMVYDTFDLSVKNPSGTGAPFISLFKASLKNGVMDIPSFGSDLVLKPERKK